MGTNVIMNCNNEVVCKFCQVELEYQSLKSETSPAEGVVPATDQQSMASLVLRRNWFQDGDACKRSSLALLVFCLVVCGVHVS